VAYVLHQGGAALAISYAVTTGNPVTTVPGLCRVEGGWAGTCLYELDVSFIKTAYDKNLFTPTYMPWMAHTLATPGASESTIPLAGTAAAAASSLPNIFGHPNFLGYGPYFFYASVYASDGDYLLSVARNFSGDLAWAATKPSEVATYAISSAPRSSVPAPLPVLGAAIALGYSRRFRHRTRLTPRADSESQHGFLGKIARSKSEN
jgi:hypothetical protein